MAVLADVARVDVRRRPARRLDAVMAVDAGARDADVVEVGRQPARRRVAVVAIVAALDMPDVLARRDHAMTVHTTNERTLEFCCQVIPGQRLLAQLRAKTDHVPGVIQERRQI